MRPLVVEIHLDYLRHNYRVARQRHGGRVLAVIKANAYGHGAVECAQALADIADGFAVSCLEEAVTLRNAGIHLPILLLEGVFEPAELADVLAYRLWLVVHNQEQLAMIEKTMPTSPYRVWLKMDSGMHRAGFLPHDFVTAYHRLMASGKVDHMVLMSHFACADEPTNRATLAQIDTFDTTVRGLDAPMSLANSAAILAYPASHRHWGRSGIMLYGSSPFELDSVKEEGVSGLKPVMCLKSQIMDVRCLPRGEAIGYGGIFVTTQPTRVGLVACGYADGYPRLASTGSPVVVAGQRTRVIGRVSMDMMTVDLTGLPDEVGIGAEVMLWGDAVLVNEVAAHAGTTSYELLCNVKRAHFNYYHD